MGVIEADTYAGTAVVSASMGLRTSLMSIICTQPASALEFAVPNDSGCSGHWTATKQTEALLTGLHVKQAP